jgi:hypothetical protein
VGVGGLLAAWSGAWSLDDVDTGYLSFFLLLSELPAWVVGIVLVMVVSLSTAAFDSFQSAMISTASNDLFRNKLNIWIIRAFVVVIIVPVVIVALKSPDILQIFLISDLVSAAVVPVLCLGLSDKFFWFRGLDFVVGGLGGIFTVFLFGLVYYHGDVTQAGNLLLLENGLYSNDWSAFGMLTRIFGTHLLIRPQGLSWLLLLEACYGVLERALPVSVYCLLFRRSKASDLTHWTSRFQGLTTLIRTTRTRTRECWNRPMTLERLGSSFSPSC